MSIEIVLLPNGLYRCQVDTDNFKVNSHHGSVLEAYIEIMGYDPTENNDDIKLPQGNNLNDVRQNARELLASWLLDDSADT